MSFLNITVVSNIQAATISKIKKAYGVVQPILYKRWNNSKMLKCLNVKSYPTNVY